MNDILERSCGLDVHKEKIVANILSGAIGTTPSSETKEFSTLIPDLIALKEWIVSCDCHDIAMESTGIYWIPVYETLETAFDGDIHLLVVNPRHMKNVPGKKTDIRDAEWISSLLRAGLLNASFIPDKDIREFRDLNRYRKSITEDITRQKNRIEKFLQASGFRLSSFLSNIFGASGRNIIHHLMEHGNITREDMDKCLKTKTRNRLDEILMSVNGTLSGHQRMFLKTLMQHYETLNQHLNEVELLLQKDMESFESHVEQLCSIYGISTIAASAIIAEIGTDMSHFRTAEHICSWAGLSPGNNESAGKRKHAHITKGNLYVKSMLCEISWVIAGKRKTYLSCWYWRLKQKKGAKKAIIALARKLLVIIYTMFKNGTMYDERHFTSRRIDQEKRMLNHYRKELEKHGYHVEATT